MTVQPPRRAPVARLIQLRWPDSSMRSIKLVEGHLLTSSTSIRRPCLERLRAWTAGTETLTCPYCDKPWMNRGKRELRKKRRHQRVSVFNLRL